MIWSPLKSTFTRGMHSERQTNIYNSMRTFEFRHSKNGHIKKLTDFIGYCKYSLISLLHIVFFKLIIIIKITGLYYVFIVTFKSKRNFDF